MKLYAGIDMGGTNIKAALSTDTFQMLCKRSIPTRRELPPREILGNVIALIEEMLVEAGMSKTALASIAMGMPGLVDFHNKIAVKLGSMKWFDVPAAAPLEEHFGVPAVIDHDGNLHTLGEWKFGAGKGCRDMILLTLGTGVGGGIIADNRLLRGASGVAGELGHMIVEIDGEKCRCGRNGCLQSYCCAGGMTGYAKKLMRENPGSVLWQLTANTPERLLPEMIDQGYDQEDRVCIDVMERTARYLSAALSTLLSALNPELILIGGGLANAGERLLNPARMMTEAAVSHPRQICKIEKAALGAEAGMFGACMLAAEAI